MAIRTESPLILPPETPAPSPRAVLEAERARLKAELGPLGPDDDDDPTVAAARDRLAVIAAELEQLARVEAARAPDAPLAVESAAPTPPMLVPAPSPAVRALEAQKAQLLRELSAHADAGNEDDAVVNLAHALREVDLQLELLARIASYRAAATALQAADAAAETARRQVEALRLLSALLVRLDYHDHATQPDFRRARASYALAAALRDASVPVIGEPSARYRFARGWSFDGPTPSVKPTVDSGVWRPMLDVLRGERTGADAAAVLRTWTVDGAMAALGFD